MPRVIAIAIAPQATTRTVAARRGAPPSRAPRSPRSAERQQRHGHGHADPRRCRRRRDGGQRQRRARRERQRRRPRGLERAAPAAARPGPARRGRAPPARRGARATAPPRRPAPAAGRAARRSAASSRSSPCGSRRSSRSSRRRSACSASRCELTETYSPAAIDSAPATRPAMPAVTIAAPDAPDAATPSTRLAVDRMPSLAPSTAARSQLDTVAQVDRGSGPRRAHAALDRTPRVGRIQARRGVRWMCASPQSTGGRSSSGSSNPADVGASRDGSAPNARVRSQHGSSSFPHSPAAHRWRHDLARARRAAVGRPRFPADRLRAVHASRRISAPPGAGRRGWSALLRHQGRLTCLRSRPRRSGSCAPAAASPGERPCWRCATWRAIAAHSRGRVRVPADGSGRAVRARPRPAPPTRRDRRRPRGPARPWIVGRGGRSHPHGGHDGRRAFDLRRPRRGHRRQSRARLPARPDVDPRAATPRSTVACCATSRRATPSASRS